MSHKAVNWALEQRHLKPGPWIVLLQLGDRHNKDTKQVNPEQATLAHDCNMSRATVNRHLDELEGLGLIQRIPRQHPITKKRLSTFYILGIDFGDPPHVEHAVSQNATRKNEGQNGNTEVSHVSECDTEAVSQNRQKPCLKNGDSRVSNCDTNPVREPVREPCAVAHTSDFDLEDLQARFVAVYPRAGDTAKLRKALAEALGAGVTPDELIAAARAYAEEQRDNRPQYIAYPENWLAQRRWERHANTARPADPNARLQAVADLIAEAKPYLCTNIPAATARDLLHQGMVTKAQCRAAGVQW